MAITMFSSTGCIRCAIVKQYLKDKDIAFEEHDIKTESGNEKFKAFYKVRRNDVKRDKAGIFFPVVEDSEKVIQDAAVNLDWFMNKGAMSAAIKENNLGHGWLGGLNISAVPTEFFDSFLEILSRMTVGGLNIAAECDGRNPALLEKILEAKLIDRLAFNIDVAKFEANDAAYIAEFEKSVYITERYTNNAQIKFSIDIALNGKAAKKELFETIAQVMEKAANNNRLAILITNKENIDANIYAYRQAMNEWQASADLKKRLY